MRRFVLLAAALCLQPLSAQALRFGIHAGWVSAQGDLRDASLGKNGFAGGIHVVLPLSHGVQVRPHVTQLRFAEAERSVDYASGGVNFRDTQTSQVEGTQLGVDLLIFGPTRRRGGYLLLGMTQDAWKYTGPYRLETLTGSQAGAVATGSRVRSSTHPGFAVGAGCLFGAHWTAELRYEFSGFGELSVSMDTLRLQAGYRF